MVGSEKVKDMIKKKFPSLSSLGSDGNTSFLRAARAGHLDKVLEQLRNNVDINTCNANGLNALHLASKDGHVHVVTELLKRGANVDSATKKGNTALHIASLAGQEEVVRLLVEHGASVNVQSQNGFTPLYMAAQENHDNVVKYLLANGANQSLATEDGFTPLAVAMQQGHDKVVAVLLENDTRGKVRLPALHIAAKKDDCKAAALLLQNEHNPDVTSKSGFTPLHIASHYGNEGIANLLLAKGADVNYAAKHNITPLHVAAKWGKSNMVSLLLEKGANIESKTRDGLTPLHCAARSGHEQVVDMLLERGAPISSKTKNGLAPLHMASQGDHVDAARILLYHRAPVDEVTVDYLTALHVAAHCGHARVAKLLLDRKADPNARALNGFTPLHIACKKNRIKVVELLLKHGASIEATTESGLTPLHVASFMGCMNIVIYLLQNEANPDVPTVRGETPLHLAARANQTDIIRILLRNGAQVDARAREQQTPLHIAARLGNVDIVMLLLQHGAAVDCTTKDLYSALHIAAKEGQDEVAAVLLENGASVTATTKKGFTPLHLAAKYGNMKVARLLLQRDAPVDAQGKNGVTPLHVASHYDHQNVALLLLDKGASPHATAKNGHTPLHIAAKKNQMDIATTLLEYGAKANAESKAGFTPLHLSSQEGHVDMSSLLIDHHADTNHKAKNGLSPLHLCAQEDRVNVASILVKNGAEVDSTTKAGYTPLHVACHFGQLGMVRFLLDSAARADATTAVGYTPLHQAAQQGHCTIVNTLLEHGAPPNATTNQGQTAMSIAQKLGYISVVETLKGVTEPATITPLGEEKYKVVSPETMQETFMSDSEDEGGEDTLLSEQPYRYLTVDEMKSLGDDSLPIDVRQDERQDSNRECMSAVDDTISPQHHKEAYSQFTTPDNIDIGKHPLHVGFLVSFLVDARGGAMRGCRHSGVRVIVPPRRASMPMRVTCRYLRRDKLTHPPPLMEGEALASRILELGPVGAKFLGPVMIEVPHFGSLRGKEREIVILRSDNGETWREHTVDCSEEAVQDVLSHSFDKEDLAQLDDSARTTRILTTDFPHYFAVVTRVRQEVHAIGPEGGMVSSSVVPQVQAVFPQGALTKKIKVGLQAQPIPAELAAKLLGNRVAVSPIVTVEPRRRKFHKPITLTIPKPQAANKGMINQYSGDAPTLRLLCSITGGTTRAQWEDVTGSTPFTFVNDCVSFTTTVSARFWLMDCRNVGDATKMATELYREAIHVPFMAKFVVFAKRVDPLEARLRIFCMTDDKEDKTLEHQEHFTEVAKSRDVEVLEGKTQYVEFAGNLVPVTKSGEQLQLGFRAFRENRLPFTARVKDPHADPVGRTLFMREARLPKGEPPQQPICVLNIVLPDEIIPEAPLSEHELHKYSFIQDSRGLESYQRVDLRLSDVSNLLGEDWVGLAHELGVSPSDINRLKTEHPQSSAQQGLAMLRLWLSQAGNKAQASTLESALQKIGRDDIVQQCVFNVDHSAVQLLKDESRDASIRRSIPYSDKDIMKDSESVEDLSRTQFRKKSDFAEKDDKEEKKYEAEEKEVEDIKKSVSERRKEIEKRLSLEKPLPHKTETITEKISTEKIEDVSEKETSEEKRVSSPEEEEPSELSFEQKRLSFEQGKRVIEMKPDKTTMKEVKERADERFLAEERKAAEKLQEKKSSIDETSIPFDEKRKSFEKSEKEEKIKEEKLKEKKDETKKEDLRRDSALFEGVSQGLVRLDAAFTAAPQVQDLLSPKASKTPPPSPAEFKDLTGTVAWTEETSTVIPTKVDQSQDWAEKGQPDSTVDASNKEHPLDGLGTPQHGHSADYSILPNDTQQFTETINIDTHEHFADKVREKDAKYQFTMAITSKEGLAEMSNTLSSFLENEKDYNNINDPSKQTEVAVVVNTEVPSSDETEELSKSESEPKSDKSFVGKMSKKIFGVFKRDEKKKSKNKKDKNKINKNESNENEKSVNVPYPSSADSYNKLTKETDSKALDINMDLLASKTDKEKSGITNSCATSKENVKSDVISKYTLLTDNSTHTEVNIPPIVDATGSVLQNQSAKDTDIDLLVDGKESIGVQVNSKNIDILDKTSVQDHSLEEITDIKKNSSNETTDSHTGHTILDSDSFPFGIKETVSSSKTQITIQHSLPAVENSNMEGITLQKDIFHSNQKKFNEIIKNEIVDVVKGVELDSISNGTTPNVAGEKNKEISEKIVETGTFLKEKSDDIKQLSLDLTDVTSRKAELSENNPPFVCSTDDSQEENIHYLQTSKEMSCDIHHSIISKEDGNLENNKIGSSNKHSLTTAASEPAKSTNQKIKSFFGELFGESNNLEDCKGVVKHSLPIEVGKEGFENASINQEILETNSKIIMMSQNNKPVESHLENEIKGAANYKSCKGEKLESNLSFQILDPNTEYKNTAEKNISTYEILSISKDMPDVGKNVATETDIDFEIEKSFKQTVLNDYKDVTKKVLKGNEINPSDSSAYTTVTNNKPAEYTHGLDKSHRKENDNVGLSTFMDAKSLNSDMMSDIPQPNLKSESPGSCDTTASQIPKSILNISKQTHTTTEQLTEKELINKDGQTDSSLQPDIYLPENNKSEIFSTKKEAENTLDNYLKSIDDSGSLDSKCLEKSSENVYDFSDLNKVTNKTNDHEMSSDIVNAHHSENNFLGDIHKSTTSNDEKLNKMLIDMLIEQECIKSPREDISTNSRTQTVQSSLFEKPDKEISEELSELRAVNSFGKIESLINDSVIKEITETKHPSEKPYITTPTMQRKKIGGSQRLSREERPTLREISHLSDYSSSDEETSNRYIVTEPGDQPSTRKVSFQVESEDETCFKVSDSNSEPDIDVTEMTPSPVPTFNEQAQVILENDAKSTKDMKTKKVEQRFERMASETLETDPEVKFTADKEFQRMVSQLSAEEVEACISQWDEEGLTPSEEQDSSNTTIGGELGPDIEALPEEVSKDVTREHQTSEADIIPPIPSPRPTKQDTQDDSTDSQKPTEDIQDYSVRKKFWEQMSSGSQDSQRSQDFVNPPVPKPRSSIVSSVPLLKSEAESDTETTATTLSDSTVRMKYLQQDAISKQSFTGSSDASDKEEVSETEATDKKNMLSGVLATAKTVASHTIDEHQTDNKSQTVATESSDSETEYIAKVGEETLAYENTGFVLDDDTDLSAGTKEHISSNKITPQNLESNTSTPVSSARKSYYARSVSLPTEDTTDISTNSVKARKRFFEAQIKKEMVVDQLMTQLEEESSPEHKSFHHKPSDVPTSDPEIMVSRQIHSHIFSHELEEQIESLVPEDKHISEQNEESEPIGPSSVKEIVSTFDKVDAKKCVKRTDSTSFEAELVQIKHYSKENMDENQKEDRNNIKTSFDENYQDDKSSFYSSTNKTQDVQAVDLDGIFISDSENQFSEEIADIIKYRSDSISKPSDSLEVHIDKSEIEESEKEMEIDEELKQLEAGLIQKSRSDFEYRDDDKIPEITITQSSKQRPESYSQGESEDTQSESDITPEDLRDKEGLSKLHDWDQEVLEHPVELLENSEVYRSQFSKSPHVHTPEEHIPDTVWEVPIQQEPESSEQEIVEDIPIEKQPILEKDEEESQRSLTESCEMKSQILQPHDNISCQRLSDNESSLTESALDLKSCAHEQGFECKLTEEEARVIAQEIVENIEIEVSKRPELLTDIKNENNISETVKNIGNTEVSDYIKKLTGKEDLEVKLIESVLAKKEREQIMKFTRTDTTTSSIEITDEDLRSSGVESDNSPLESQGSRLCPAENQGEEDSTADILSHEKDLDDDLEKNKDKEVVEKTLAEVKESLEAAQDELIEEQKKKKEIHKKPSPSEFEFKALALERFADEYIEECHSEESTAVLDSKLIKENEQYSAEINVSVKEKDVTKKEAQMHVEENIHINKDKETVNVFDSSEVSYKNRDISNKVIDVCDSVLEKKGETNIKKIHEGSASFLEDQQRSTNLKCSQSTTVTSDSTTEFKSQQASEKEKDIKEESFLYSSLQEESTNGYNFKILKLKNDDKKVEKLEELLSQKEEIVINLNDNELKNETYIESSKMSSKSVSEVKEEFHSESKIQSSVSSSGSCDVQKPVTSERQIFKEDFTDIEKEETLSVNVNRKEEIKRTYSEESQKSSQDESIKSHTGIEGGISSSSSSGKKEDSDAMLTLGQPEVVLRKRKTDKSSSQKRSDRRSGTDYEPYSSSGESYYHSFEQTSESGRTPSRPCSSDIDALIAGVGTTGSSEYESAISHEMSGRSLTSYEYHTAVSSLSSRESMKSLDSESSGNLASVEISSEASETLVPSAMELESDMDGLAMHMVEEECFLKHKPILEPYDQDIPHHIIKGESPPRIPPLSDIKDYGQSASLDISSEGGISEEDGEASLSASRDEDILDKSTKMKRSHEMTFQPEPRPITFDTAGSESLSHEDKYGSSLDDTVSIFSASSTSDTPGVLTIIERSRTESEKMDGSANSDQLSLTVSGTSEQISLSSVCDDMNIQSNVSHETIATQSLTQDAQIESVLLMTSSVFDDGIQSVSTQVTSQTEIPPTKINELIEDGYTCSNGPTQVEYNAEYDDVKEIRKRPGHRRSESTSFKPSLIPVLKKREVVETKVEIGTVGSNDDAAESEKYEESTKLTLKEDRNDEKKDVDEAEKVYEESYQTEADQGFHRDMREARQAFEDMSSLEEEHEELQNIEESRPQSQISKSDSESGQRPISSGFSDDRPDSELAELLKQCSSDACSEDPIERPKTPEPSEDCEIKDDTPEFSSEAQASVTELELEYSGAISRTLEYEAHISPIREKVSSLWEHSTSDHEEELAEAEAAFQMVPHIIPHLSGVPHPDTILEDPIAEKHELETREIALKEQILKRAALIEATSPGSIPDITITQHMTPLIDRGFHYPDLELEEASTKASAPQTPASISSRASSETETDQGKEYVLGDDGCDDFVAEELDVGESSVTTEEKTVFESKDDFQERGSATDSPNSDSFEMLEKPDITDEFVIIEEVGKEAHEQDREGKSMAICKKRIAKKTDDTEDEVVVSPPAPVTRMTEIKYYPTGGAAFPFDSDSPPTNTDGVQSGEATSQEGSPPSDVEHEYESEVEAGKKWIEMQFQGDQATAVYGYELDYERGPLEDIKEEPDLENNSSRFGSLGSQVSQSAGSFGSMKESFSSTPDYDVLAGRKYFTRSGDHDDVSMSSLQEFERLENLIAMEINRNKSSGSQDSLNSSGNSKRHTGSGKSGGDDISLASLKEFEGLEHACIEAAKIELKAKEEEAVLLSEIEEGHESQASESESCETISAGGLRSGESDEDDYEKRMFEIDEIIRQAQTNVERFIDVKEKDSLTESSAIEKTESMGRGDSIEEVSKIPDLDLDQPLSSLAAASAFTHLDKGSTVQQWKGNPNISSKHHSETLTTSTDSLEMKVASDIMSASTDSIEFQAQQKKLKGKDVMTDSIEVIGDKTSMLTSTDSLETDPPKYFSDSIDEEDGGHTTWIHDQSSSSGRDGDLSFSGKDDYLEANRMPPPRADLLLGSTDSLEPSSSTATHATYQYETDSVMSSSFTSGGSNTMMSSTETLDTGLRTAVWFDDNKPYVTEVIEPCEEGDGFVHTIHRTVEMPPEIHNVTFRGPDADKALKEYIDHFGPGEDVTETQQTDAAGNVHTMRVIQRRVVMKPDDFKGPSSRLSEAELDEYLKQSTEKRDQMGFAQTGTHTFSSSPAQQSFSHHTIITRHVTSHSPKQELISTQVKGDATGEDATSSPLPSPLPMPSAITRETDEALLDLAAGLQDNKGSSGGVGPSDSK